MVGSQLHFGLFWLGSSISDVDLEIPGSVRLPAMDCRWPSESDKLAQIWCAMIDPYRAQVHQNTPKDGSGPTDGDKLLKGGGFLDPSNEGAPYDERPF